MEKKKIKFNGMDLFIIITIAAIAAAGVYILAGRDGGAGTAASKEVEVTTVVELAGRDKEFADIIQIGDVVAIGEKEKAMTTVDNVEISPAETVGYDIVDGRVLSSEIPEEYDIKVTLKGEGTETESAIEITGSAIKVGQEAVLSSKNWAGQGYVIGLDAAQAK